MSKFRVLLSFLMFGLAPQAFSSTGILVIAHGTMCHGHGHEHDHGDECEPSVWEQAVLDAVETIRHRHAEPVEVAFGMWNTKSFDAGIARLTTRLAPKQVLTNLIVVPLFISSHSIVTEMQQYIFRQRPDRPFPIQENPVNFTGSINFLSSIDYDPIVSRILTKRAESLVSEAGAAVEQTELILVMHGPVGETHNHRWLSDAQRYAADLSTQGFAEIHTVSLRDDAEPPVRGRATEILRETVEGVANRSHQALILPLLVAGGGIEGGILERLAGLNYVWKGEMLLPDTLIGEYIAARIDGALR